MLCPPHACPAGLHQQFFQIVQLMSYVFLNDRDAPEVASQPEVNLAHWRILRTDMGDLHLCAKLSDGTLRFTTPLIAVDLSLALAITTSGRRYRLEERPEQGELVRGMLLALAAHWGLEDAVDVSNPVWEAINTGVWTADLPRLV